MRKFLQTLALAAALAATTAAAIADARPARRGAQHKPRPVAAQQAPAAAPATARPAMWKVADADTTIYLFGTVHALPKGIGWFDGAVANAFETSQELVTEIVETDPGQMQAAVMATGTLPEGKSLRGMLTPPQRTAYEAAMKANGLPEAAFDRLKPWYVAVFLSALPVLKDGFDPEHGVEKVLDARARALRRPHSALETAEYQLGLFDGLPEATQLRFLNEVVATLPQAKNELREMIAAWQTGDAAALARLMNEDQDEPLLMERLITNRNKAWADWIQQRLDRPGTVFMAVGAGHLAGAGSVQDQLAGKGVVTTRIQ